MSYTIEIKEEISQNEATNSEMIAELSGFFRNNGEFNHNKLYLTTENKFVIERIKSFLKKLYEVDIDVRVKNNLNFNKKDLYSVILKDKVPFILQALGYHDEANHYMDTPPTYLVGGNEEIRAYLRGVFLCVGSINNPKTSRYHMELLISKANEAVFVQKLLNVFDLNAKILKRDKGYMIYIKEAEKISDYIKILGASKAVLFFEDARIYRSKKNQTNRLNNCEQANMDKVFETANAQLKQIQIIEDNDAYDLLDDKAKEAFNYRKKYPESSLKELSEIISLETSKPITKSGLSHRFKKIKDLAERLNSK